MPTSQPNTDWRSSQSTIVKDEKKILASADINNDKSHHKQLCEAMYKVEDALYSWSPTQEPKTSPSVDPWGQMATAVQGATWHHVQNDHQGRHRSKRGHGREAVDRPSRQGFPVQRKGHLQCRRDWTLLPDAAQPDPHVERAQVCLREAQQSVCNGAALLQHEWQ